LSAFHDIEAKLRRNLLILFTAGLFFWSSMASLLPTLPLYVEDIGASKQQIGVVMGSFAIGLLLFRPQLGKLADKRSRKLALIIGTLVAAIAPLGYAVIDQIPLLMVLRAFHGISIAAFTTGFSTLVTDLAPVEKRGEIIGYMSLVNPIGMATGPALGGYLQSQYGYLPLFLFATTSALISLSCVSQVFCPVVAKKSYTAGEDVSLWRILLSPRIRIPTLVMFLVGLAFGTLSTFVPLFIKSLQIDLNAGLFYSTAAITSFSSRLVMGRVSDRIGRGLFVTIGIVCYSVSMFLLWQASSKASFLLAALIEGVGGGMMIPSIVTMMADRSQPQERGRVFALCVGGFDVGIAIAGPILGSVAEKMGYRSMFGFASFLTFIAIFIFMTQSSKNIRNSFNFALGKGKDVYAITE
jgi:MFS family permease